MDPSSPASLNIAFCPEVNVADLSFSTVIVPVLVVPVEPEITPLSLTKSIPLVALTTSF